MLTCPWRMYATVLMSDSCPTNVCVHLPERKSHVLAVESVEPETNRAGCAGQDETDITSDVWSVNRHSGSERSMSQKIHVESPDAVSMCVPFATNCAEET